MKSRISHALTVLGALALIAGHASVAAAQCRPDDIFCAELRIGPAQPPPPPPPVVVMPPPPPVVVMPPPPQQQPPVVIIQPGPPPPPRQIVVMQTAPPRQPATVAVQIERRRTVRYELVPDFDLGLHVNFGVLATENVGMGGFSGAFRLRPIPWIAFDVGLGGYYGQDYQGRERGELPVTASMLVYFNPFHRVQFYMMVGGGMSWAQTGRHLDRTGAEHVYAGGEAGIGLEWRVARHFALNVDFRGFLRERVGGESTERFEFTRTLDDGSVQGTNTSGGFYATVGMTWYFGR